MSIHSVSRDYYEALAFLQKERKSGKEIGNGQSKEMDEAITKVATYIQIQRWKDLASQFESDYNKDEIWDYISDADVDKIMERIKVLTI